MSDAENVEKRERRPKRSTRRMEGKDWRAGGTSGEMRVGVDKTRR